MTKKLKILYFAMVELDVPEGPSVHTLNLVKGFKELGARVLLLCPKPRKSYKNPDLNESIFLPFWGFASWQLRVFDFVSFLYLIYAFLIFRPNVFLAREAEGNLSVLAITWIFQVPLIVDTNGPFTMDFISLPKFEYPSNRFRKFYTFVWRKIWRTLFFKTASGLTSNGVEWRDDLCAEFNFPKTRFKVVNMHVDTECFKPLNKAECRKKLGIPLSRIVMGYVGSFQPYHDIDVMFQSLQLLREQNQDVELRILGGGKKLETLRVKYEKFPHLDRIHFEGWVPHHEIPFHLNVMTVGIALIKTGECSHSEFALKFKEYLACGIPVIANGNQKIFEAYPSRSVLRLGTHYQAADLAKAVLEAAKIIHEPILDEAVRFIQKNYSLRHAAEETLAVLDEENNI